MSESLRELGEVADEMLDPLIEWITRISLSEWPQQSRGVPAMVNDLAWHSFGAMTSGLVERVQCLHYPGCISDNRMLSVVMPGDEIEPHRDRQRPPWLTRVHVPLVTNPHARFAIGGLIHWMGVGSAYAVDVTEEHYVTNQGDTPRIHFMFDVERF